MGRELGLTLQTLPAARIVRVPVDQGPSLLGRLSAWPGPDHHEHPRRGRRHPDHVSGTRTRCRLATAVGARLGCTARTPTALVKSLAWFSTADRRSRRRRAERTRRGRRVRSRRAGTVSPSSRTASDVERLITRGNGRGAAAPAPERETSTPHRQLAHPLHLADNPGSAILSPIRGRSRATSRGTSGPATEELRHSRVLPRLTFDAVRASSGRKG